MSAKEFATHRKVHPSTVSKWGQKQLLVKIGNRIDVAASDAILNHVEEGWEQGCDPKNFNEAQFMKETYLAKLRRLEFLQKQGELIELSAVRKSLADIMRQHRDGLLAIPVRLAAPLAVEMDQSKTHAILQAEITEHLNGLADALERR